MRRRSGGSGLLIAAIIGVLAALVVPRRYGRRGGLAVLAGVTVLLTRDLTMTLAGTPARLKFLPQVLLYLELASAATATLLGLGAWLRPAGRSRRGGGRSLLAANHTVSAAASSVAALTFLLHTSRQAIYLTPGKGRREAAAEPESGANAVGVTSV